MDAQHRRLYIQWCQSERVKLSVDRADGPAETFLFPRDLLRRRSRKFHELFTVSVPVVEIPDTSVETMQDFFVWTLSPQPQVDERASFEEVVRLGIFAWKYQISALSNQLTDMIRSNLAYGNWQLQASMVDDIYEATPAGSPLREVVRAMLGQLPPSTTEREGITKEEWKAAILKHADLGWDCYEAKGSQWTRQEYLTGVCRFHDHTGAVFQNGSVDSWNGCPHAQEECYPRWDFAEITGIGHHAKEVKMLSEINGVREDSAVANEPLKYAVFESQTDEPAILTTEEEPAENRYRELSPVPAEDLKLTYVPAEQEAAATYEPFYLAEEEPKGEEKEEEVEAEAEAEAKPITFDEPTSASEPELELANGYVDDQEICVLAEEPATGYVDDQETCVPAEEPATQDLVWDYPAPSETNGVAIESVPEEAIPTIFSDDDVDGVPIAAIDPNGHVEEGEKADIPLYSEVGTAVNGVAVEPEPEKGPPKKKRNKKKRNSATIRDVQVGPQL